MEFVSMQNLAENLKHIKKGAAVLVTTDITSLAYNCRKNGERFDPNVFINSLQKAVGENGTLLIPCFNWDFCKTGVFDVKNTKSKAGILGDYALAREDFKRTKHPLYSFAVWGKDAQILYEAKAKTSFGADSPFAYLYTVNGQSLTVGISPTIAGTFVHYTEQCLECPLRYEKEFSGVIIDENGEESPISAIMYVRNLDYDLSFSDRLDKVLKPLNIYQTEMINDVPFHTMDFKGLHEVTALDIIYNKARIMYDYDWQKYDLDFSICEGKTAQDYIFLNK